MLSSTDEKAIRDLDLAYVQGVRAKDWRAVADLLTPGAVLLPPSEPAVVGRAANLTRFQGFQFESVNYEHTPTHIDGDGTVGYLQGAYSIRMTFASGVEPFVDSGKYLWVLRCQSTGLWLIDRVMWNSDPSKGAA